MKQDRNFDDIADKFVRNIYGTTKGRIRQAILWQDLDTLLAAMPAGPLHILDAGGGEGPISRQLARRGHQVTLCDLSRAMLDKAEAAARQDGVLGRMRFIHSPVQQIETHLPAPVDLILCHAMLEWVAEPQPVIQCLARCLRPGGALSLMFYNRHGLVMRNMVLGNFAYVEAGMPKRKRRSLSPDYPCDPAQVLLWLHQADLTVTARSGVRVFHDYLRDKQQQTDCFAQLLALESRYCRQAPYVDFGRYQHVIAHKSMVKKSDE